MSVTQSDMRGVSQDLLNSRALLQDCLKQVHVIMVTVPDMLDWGGQRLEMLVQVACRGARLVPQQASTAGSCTCRGSR